MYVLERASVRVCVCMRLCMRKAEYVRVRVHMCVHVFPCMCMYVYVSMCMYVCACV